MKVQKTVTLDMELISKIEMICYRNCLSFSTVCNLILLSNIPDNGELNLKIL